MAFELVARNGLIALNNSIVTGSLNVTNGITGSLFGTASWVVQALTASSADNFNVRGTLTATTIVAQVITSSTDFVTGSTRFGSLLTNTHVFSGSVTMNPGGLFVSSSGNVGIGTTSPSAKLHIYNGSTGYTAYGNTYLIVENSARAAIQLLAPDASDQYVFFGSSLSGAQAYIGYEGYSGGDGLILHSSTGDIFFRAGGTDKMRIKSGGNVGIGTTSPGTILQVSPGSSYANNPTIQIVSSYADGYDAVLSLNNTHTGGRNWSIRSTNNSRGTIGGGKLVFQDTTAGSDTAVMTLVTGGSVGIGTTSPATALQVNGTARATRINSTGGIVDFDAATGNNFISVSSGNMSIANNGTVNVYVSGSGNVGIGTTAPTSILHVRSSDGTVRFASSTGNDAGRIILMEVGSDAWSIDGGQANGTFLIRDEYNSSTRLAINNNGNVGIGTTSPTSKLNVNGNIGFAGDTDKYLYMPDVNQGTGSIYMQAGFGSATAGGAIRLYGHNATSYTGGDVEVGLSNKGNFLINTYIGGARLVTVKVDGNVGIGTTSPDERLTVGAGNGISIRTVNSGTYGALKFGTNNATYAADWAGIDSDWEGVGVNVSNLRFYTSYGAISEKMRISAGGNVGIGTTTPTAKLHVSGTTGGVFEVDGAAAVNALYVSASGNVGIGTTSPTTPLRIDGGAAGTGGWNKNTTLKATYPVLIFNSNDTKWAGIAYDYSAAMRIWVNASNDDVSATTAVVNILNNGNVGIGTTSPTLATLQVNGNIHATSFTGSLLGTASFATSAANATSASYATFAATATSATSATSAGSATSASYATFAATATSATSAGSATSASYATFAATATTATTATNWSGYNAGLLNWTTANGTSTSGQNRMAARLYSLGRKIYLDETFNYGVNSLNVYDNNSTGTVSITRVSAPYGVSTSGYQAQIQHTGASQAPGYGGFYFATQTRSNATLACVFRAKLASGYTIDWASNATGNGGNNYWATDNIGTGKYEDYVYVVRCGDSGTFSSTMFFYITGTPAPSGGSPLTWYLSSATVYDVDDRDNTNTQGYTPLTSNNYNSYAPTLTGTGASGTWGIDITGNAATATSASYATFAATATSATSATSAGSATSASYATFAATATSATSATSAGSATSASYATFAATASSANGFTVRETLIALGSVGIGTTLPGSLLQVNGKTVVGSDSSNALEVFSNGDTEIGFSYATRGNIYAKIIGDVTDASPLAGEITFQTAQGGTLYERVRINKSGSVGIGTSSPTSPLHLRDSTNGFVGLRIEGSGTYAGSDFTIFASALSPSSADDFLGFYNNSTTDGATSEYKFRLFKSGVANFVGNVGIGTTSPNAKLEVNGNIYTTSNTNFLLFGTSSAINPYIQGGSDNSLYIGNNNTSRISISGSGNVGIGTTSPAYKLDVNGDARFGDGNNFNPLIQYAGSGRAVGSPGYSFVGDLDTGMYNPNLGNTIAFSTAGTERIRIISDGNVGIGTTSPNALLDVAGGITGRSSRISTSVKMPLGHYSAGETVFELDPTWTQAQLQDYLGSSAYTWNSTSASAAPGGYAIQIDGAANIAGGGLPMIPVDTSSNDLYYMECWIKNEAGSSIQHYMGSIDLDKDFAYVGGNPGTYTYNVMLNYNPGTSWTKVTGYWYGIGTSSGVAGTGNQNNWATGAKYFSPMALFNYNTISGTTRCYISGWKIIKMSYAGKRYFDGNVGIGTYNPAYKLEVNGATGISGQTTITSDSTEQLTIKTATDTNRQLLIGYNYAGNYGAIQVVQQSVAYRDLILNQSGGNVGIGTTSTSFKLDVAGTGRISGNTLIGPGLTAIGGLSLLTGGTSPISNRITYGTDGTGWKFAIGKNQSSTITDQFTIQDNGNVGIGTTSPAYALDVSGSVNFQTAKVKFIGGGNYNENIRMYAQSNDYSSIAMGAVAGDTGTGVGQWTIVRWPSVNSYQFTIRYNATDNMTITTGGTLTMVGDVVAYSDARVKKDILPITGALEKIMKIQGVSYVRTDVEDDTSTKIGFIAQEIKDILPEVVTYNKEKDRYGVSYGNITALLVEAVKEQQNQIDELKYLLQTINK